MRRSNTPETESKVKLVDLTAFAKRNRATLKERKAGTQVT
jgi:hypothetical protein